MESGSIKCFILVAVFSVIFLFVGNRFAGFERDEDIFMPSFKTGVVTEITSRVQQEGIWGVGTIDTTLTFYVRLTTRGERRGDVVEARQHLSTRYLTDEKEVEAGDRVILFHDDYFDDFFFANYVRINTIAVLGVIFLVLVIIFARKKGFNAIVSLGFTCLAIFLVFIPSILGGRNIYLATIIICAYAIVSTLLLVIGPGKKAWAAMLGCLGGVLLAGVMMLFTDRVLNLTGIFDEETQHIIFLFTENPINLRAIIFAGVILGAVGAIMDVAMSIASSLWELRLAGGVTDFAGIVKSGISIGKDILGTMLNTLILAYIGSSLSLILLLSAHSPSLVDLINDEMIIVEFIRALVGSFGMLLAIPLTAAVCGWLYAQEL
ncbi:MAG: YibE/F family protein [Defluviitaleaceae bacterium]|nr:YibE/F family protein [Defluviitaleaceae bacterium]